MKRIMFNCSINVTGGAVQNAGNFIRCAAQDKSDIEYFFIVSSEVLKLLISFDVSVGKNFLLVESPSRSLGARKKMLQAEREFQPDIVYTMAGPTYVRFRAYHFMGISDPYITHAKLSDFFVNRSFFAGMKYILMEQVKAIHARFNANHFLFQTEISRNGFCKRYMVEKNRTSILPNAISMSFMEELNVNSVYKEQLEHLCVDRVVIFVPSAYYPHKNIEYVYRLSSYINSLKLDKKYLFILTIPSNALGNTSDHSMGRNSLVVNIGPFLHSHAAYLYSLCDVVFIPSILETFSTSYIEAIYMRKPLIASDRDFVREVCGDQFFAYDECSVEQTFRVIEKITEKNLEKTPLDCEFSQSDRYSLFLNIVRRVLPNN